jgi:hypothetical protein
MDVKTECQKIYDDAVTKIKVEAETRKIPEQDMMRAFGLFDQFKPELSQLRLAIAEIPEYLKNYQSRKLGIITKYNSSANEELFLKKFTEAVKAKDFNVFFGFIGETFL